MSRVRLCAPNGLAITGTAEVVQAVAQAKVYLEDGSIEVEYQGGSEVDWDSQTTRVNEGGKRIFVDEDGEEWGEDQLIEQGDDD